MKSFRGQHCSSEAELKKGQHLSLKTEIKKGEHLSPETEIKRCQHLSPNTEFKKGQKMPWVGERNKRITTKGIGCSDAIKAKISQAEKGRHLSPETEIKKGQRISQRTELTSDRVKSWWEAPEYRAKVIAARLKNRRPTGLEKKLISIIKRHNLPFKYTGDGSFILEGLNPDFIEVNGKKVAIDVFGDYWHTLKATRESYTEDGRKAIFAKYGWELIIIWGHELKSLSEETVIQMLKR